MSERAPASVVAEVASDLHVRAAVGLRKYGVPLEGRTDLARADWLQHAYEEALDMACYLKCLIRLERAKNG